MCVRQLILDRLLKIKPKLTPFEWLALQLHPKSYFGVDVFDLVYSRAREKDGMEGLPIDHVIPQQMNRVVFVDEAQVLIEGNDFLSSNGAQQRPLLSPMSSFFRKLRPDFFRWNSIGDVQSPQVGFLLWKGSLFFYQANFHGLL